MSVAHLSASVTKLCVPCALVVAKLCPCFSVASFEAQPDGQPIGKISAANGGIKILEENDTVTCVDAQLGSLFAGTMGGSVLQLVPDTSSDTLRLAVLIGNHDNEVSYQPSVTSKLAALHCTAMPLAQLSAYSSTHLVRCNS